VCFSEYHADCSLRPMFTLLVQAAVSCIWTNDSQRILLEHFDAIHKSPSHLYHYALPFSPSSSWLHECYTAEHLQVVKVVKGLLAEWGTCLRTVLLNDSPWTLSYWNNTIAVGSECGDILILDAITGSQTAVLPGHTGGVSSLTFSPDGTSIVSGSSDETVKLWDVQTGGVVKTFHGHNDQVLSVSISADHATIASGSDDKTLRLWDIQTGECHKIIEQQEQVSCVRFSPMDPQCLMAVSGGLVQQWDADGHRVGPMYDCHHVAFSPDGTLCARCMRGGIIIQKINSGVVVASFDMTNSFLTFCCLSPDSRLVAAAAAAHHVWVWDITGSHPHLIETFVGHTTNITSLEFSSPSVLVSVSSDRSVKFWKIGASSIDTAVTNPKSPDRSVTPKATDDITPPSNLDRVVGTWGISTNPYKGSLQISAKDPHQRNFQPVETKLISVWYTDGKVNIWDTEGGKLLQTINVPIYSVKDLRVSGDGSKIFCIYEESIQAWDIWTGEALGRVEILDGISKVLAIDSSTIWVSSQSCNLGWDFRTLGLSPIRLHGGPPDRIYLGDTRMWEINTSRIMNMSTWKVLFQLPQKFERVDHVQWGGQYLVASLLSKEVLILDFSHTLLCGDP